MAIEYGTVLDEAKTLVNGDRLDTYGTPAQSFNCIAALWTAYLGSAYPNAHVKLSAKDVALLMVLLKVARESRTSGRDNLVDAAAYAALAADVAYVSDHA